VRCFLRVPCVQDCTVMGADPAVPMASADGNDGLLPLRRAGGRCALGLHMAEV
jgi:hypothetical protein